MLKIKNKKYLERKRPGFSLIEIIVYIGILTVISSVGVNTLLVVHASLAEIRVTRTMNAVSSVVMESMARTIRDAKTVDVSGSSFDVSPGVLIVVDNALPAAAHRFSIGSNRLKYQRNAEPAIDLTPPGTLASNLVFRLINASTTSQAIKMELTLEASSGKATTTQNFYNTIVLRNSYSQ